MAVVKLKFSAYKSESDALSNTSPSYMYAQINPTGYELSFKNKYADITPVTAPGTQKAYVKPESQVLQLNDIIIDQTVIMYPITMALGSEYSAPTVYAYVNALKALLQTPYSSTHIPRIINVNWGTFSFTGICLKFVVNYTLFSSDGFPLRAKLNVELSGTSSQSFSMASLGFNSPDLTHLRTANAGDNLPLLSSEIYGNSKYYVELARINNLNSVFDVLPGDKVIFPPLKK
jgi:hypothetical protein